MELQLKNSKLFKGEIFSAGAWMILATIFTGVLGYAFQILIGRLLSIQEFGAFGAFFAIISFLTVPKEVLSNQVARYCSNQVANGHTTLIGEIYIFGITVLLTICALGSSLIVFFGDDLLQKITVGSTFFNLNLAALICVTMLMAFNQAILQGLKKFKAICLLLSTGMGLKFLACSILLSLGFGLGGAIGGVTIAATCTLILSFVFLWLYLPIRFGMQSASFGTRKGVWKLFFSNFVFTVCTQTDVILVKVIFGSQNAGIFLAASVIAKTVLFVPGALNLALFPLSAHSKAEGRLDKRMLYQSLAFTLISGFFCTAVFFFFADDLISLAFSARYQEAAFILKIYGFCLLPVTLSLVAEKYFLARDEAYFASPLLLLLGVSLLIGINLGVSVETLIKIYGVSSAAAFAVGMIRATVFSAK